MCAWKTYPTPEIPSPVLALASWQNQLWAGGAGGVAWYHDSQWQLSTGLPLGSCSALVFASGRLLAGGSDGLAFSIDGGQSWERADIAGAFQPVMALAASPAIDRDLLALAGTLGGGILRTENAGKNWKYANFGLKNLQVLTLAWNEGDTVLAGTDSGIFRSTNAGLAWRAALGSEGHPVAGLLHLADGTVLAVSDGCRLLRSTDSGERWTAMEADGLPADGEVQSLRSAPWGALLLSLSDEGVFQSKDGGAHWEPFLQEDILELHTSGGRMVAGLEFGAADVEEDGLYPLPPPPLHDLRSLMVYRQAPVLTGMHSGAWMYGKREGWRPLLDESEIVTMLTEAPDGALLLSCSRGLLRSKDGGDEWESVLPGEAGSVAYITFRPNGFGWAASADGTRMIRTRDHGKHWEEVPSPFGGMPLAALQAAPRALMAATVDPARMMVQLWLSSEDGLGWSRGPEARTPWPVVVARSNPPLLTVGGTVLLLQANHSLTRHAVPSGAIRRVASSGKLLLVLTTTGLYRSTDRAASWENQPDTPSHYEIVDMTLTDDGLYLLLTGGRVWMQPKETAA